MFKLSAYTSLLFLVMIAVTVACTAGNAAGVAIPGPTVDAAKAAKSGEQTVVVAGGCFWGIQAVFQHVKGVKSATSGYSGGDAKTAQYEIVSTGETGHAESVKITYDPAQITYGELCFSRWRTIPHSSTGRVRTMEPSIVLWFFTPTTNRRRLRRRISRSSTKPKYFRGRL